MPRRGVTLSLTINIFLQETMPQIDITTILFQAISNLTGGLISDLTSVMLGMVLCTFILMGLDYIKDVFVSGFEDLRNEKAYKKYSQMAEDILVSRDTYEKGSYHWKEENLIHQEMLRKAVRARANKMDKHGY